MVVLVKPGADPRRVAFTVSSTEVDGATPETVIPPCVLITAVPRVEDTDHTYVES